MNKPTSTYKMNSQTKSMLTRILDPHKRGEWKRMMIDAELEAAKRVKEPLPKDLKD